MSKLVCKYCIALYGVRGSDLAKWPDSEDPKAEEWLFNHIEKEHGIPVIREGETVADALVRHQQGKTQ